MADSKDIELTAKEKALQHFTGKNPREENPNNDTPTEEELKLKAENEAKALQEKEDAEKLRLAEEEKNKIPQPRELTDEELLAIASKKAGREIKSWDEFKPKQEEIDKEKEQEKRDANKLSYGLQKGLFNKNTYESFIADSKDRIGLVYRAELEDAKANDTAWDEDKEKEFKAEFDEKFGLELDPTSAQYKRGQKRISVIADSLLKSTYAPIYNLESEYGKYESGVNAQKETQQKILAQAPIFKQDVADVLSELSTVEISFGSEKYPILVSKEIRDSVNEILLDENFVKSQILEGHKKETLSKIAYNLIITQNFDTLSFEAAKQYRAKHEKGVRGIPEGGKLDNEIVDDATLSDKQKQAISFFKKQEQPVAN